MLTDYASAPISNREKALFALVEKANRDAAGVTKSDIDSAIAAGWPEEAIFDAVTVCALFRFFNTWTDALGARDGNAALHANSGKRLAEHGYLPGD